MKQLDLKFRDLVLIAFILGVMYVCCVSCTTSRPRPAEQPPLVAQTADSLSLAEQATLPPYLVPVPLGSSKAQQRKWQRAQRRNLAKAGHAPEQVKVKNSTVATGDNATAVGKAKAPVATGGARAQDFTKSAKHGGALATEPGATAGATTHTGIPPWALVVGLSVLLVILLVILAYQFRKRLGGLLLGINK